LSRSIIVREPRRYKSQPGGAQPHQGHHSPVGGRPLSLQAERLLSTSGPGCGIVYYA
jgi:hypothetical protein